MILVSEFLKFEFISIQILIYFIFQTLK